MERLLKALQDIDTLLSEGKLVERKKKEDERELTPFELAQAKAQSIIIKLKRKVDQVSIFVVGLMSSMRRPLPFTESLPSSILRMR